MTKYLRIGGPVRTPDPKQRWLTFVHNHAKVIVACDFFVVVTATFRVLYVFVMLALGTRRILHLNITAHPTADWTLQQFREALPDDHSYRFVLHDRDSIFSRELDRQVTKLRVRTARGSSRPRSRKAVHPVSRQCRRAVRKTSGVGMDAQDCAIQHVTS